MVNVLAVVVGFEDTKMRAEGVRASAVLHRMTYDRHRSGANEKKLVIGSWAIGSGLNRPGLTGGRLK